MEIFHYQEVELLLSVVFFERGPRRTIQCASECCAGGAERRRVPRPAGGRRIQNERVVEWRNSRASSVNEGGLPSVLARLIASDLELPTGLQ
jgi:hypothetical protein